MNEMGFCNKQGSGFEIERLGKTQGYNVDGQDRQNGKETETKKYNDMIVIVGSIRAINNSMDGQH